jgi:DNA repair protein RadA/Sms
MRAERILGNSAVEQGGVQLLPSTDVGAIIDTITRLEPFLVVIDSIQTLYDPAFPSTPGSIVQVRETALRLQQMAKQKQVAVILVGHITKEGTVAGPRTLEHLVDTVLYLEGDEHYQLRILRAVKNRFGDVSETGLFAMEAGGLQEVANPTDFLLSERVVAPGCVLTAVLEGNRPLLIEVQALTTPTVFGNPRRTSSGFDVNRLNLLLAILQRRGGIDLSAQDVYVNIVGGLKTKDPGVDAAVCLALASAVTGQALPENLCVIGEVGLAGEVRKVAGEQRRRKAIASLGYKVNKELQDISALVKAYLAPNKKIKA